MRAQRNLAIMVTAYAVLVGPLAGRSRAAPTQPRVEARATPTPAPLAVAASATKSPLAPAKASTPKALGTSHAASPVRTSDVALGPEEHARRMHIALSELKGTDPAAIQRALLELRELQGRAAAEGIVARLGLGLPPQLTETALQVLGELNQPLAVPVLSELTLHRRWQIRQRAVAALGALHVRSSVSVLLYALDDPSAEVRSSAARALGRVGDPRATPALEAALERGVDGALEGIAQLATNRQVDGILARAKSALTACAPALTVLIARPNLPPVTKLKVIAFVLAHDSEGEAEQLLARWKEQLEHAGDHRLLAALTPRATSATRPQAATEVVQMARVPAKVAGGTP